jgi:hypothetical protein
VWKYEGSSNEGRGSKMVITFTILELLLRYFSSLSIIHVIQYFGSFYTGSRKLGLPIGHMIPLADETEVGVKVEPSNVNSTDTAPSAFFSLF